MRFGPKEVVKDLSFVVDQGEVFGLLGSNGAGKTTTIRTLLSLLEPTSGTLLVNGKRYTPAMAARLAICRRSGDCIATNRCSIRWYILPSCTD